MSVVSEFKTSAIQKVKVEDLNFVFLFKLKKDSPLKIDLVDRIIYSRLAFCQLKNIPVRQIDLEAFTGIPRKTIYRAIKRLTELGLVDDQGKAVPSDIFQPRKSDSPDWQNQISYLTTYLPKPGGPLDVRHTHLYSHVLKEQADGNYAAIGNCKAWYVTFLETNRLRAGIVLDELQRCGLLRVTPAGNGIDVKAAPLEEHTHLFATDHEAKPKAKPEQATPRRTATSFPPGSNGEHFRELAEVLSLGNKKLAKEIAALAVAKKVTLARFHEMLDQAKLIPNEPGYDHHGWRLRSMLRDEAERAAPAVALAAFTPDEEPEDIEIRNPVWYVARLARKYALDERQVTPLVDTVVANIRSTVDDPVTRTERINRKLNNALKRDGVTLEEALGLATVAA